MEPSAFDAAAAEHAWTRGSTGFSSEARMPADEAERLVALADADPKRVAEGEAYRARLRAAGNGGSRQTIEDGEGAPITFRFNPLTNMAVVRVCAVCGSADNVKSCAGCRSFSYCSRACQVRHWPAHKALCEEIKASRAGRGEPNAPEQTSATFDKFLVNFPSIHEHCEEAVRLGAVLPIVHIKTGTTGANHVVSFPGPKTMSALRALQEEHRELKHIFRLDDDMEPGFTRVVVVIEHANGGLTAQRLRIRSNANLAAACAELRK